MLEVGKILKAHGIRGDVKIECFTDSPEALTGIKRFYVEGTEYKAERIKPFGAFALIKLVGIDDMNLAETLRNKTISAKKEDMPEPKDGAFYIDDLIGCSVFDDRGTRHGIVEDILQYGSADVFLSRENGKTIMFPHLKKVVKEIVIKEKRIVVFKEEFDKVAVYED